MLQTQWQVSPSYEIPAWFIEAVCSYVPNSKGQLAAQLLWQRGIKERQQLIEFLDPNAYKPSNPFAFGEEMKRAVNRLINARINGEKVTIWGDFDADGITATSVLWEGLGQFLTQHLQLNYYIPNRDRESHGLNCTGIDRVAASGTKLIVTCDTGSTNLQEIDYANQLGIDIIITDHHTLPEERPPVIAIINPRYFAESHPLFHLSGVAVAYKLVEALYQSLPDISQQPVEELLDLVAIGLIADLVQLSGDCRYLAQKGIQKLQERSKTDVRPGVKKLLELCQKNGDRPTDISFGIGPRINAVSRIHGEATFCVELLTSRDSKCCQQLAELTELANTRRKALQKDVIEQVKQKLSRLDLSTTSVIVLEDPQWQSGVLGLVAGQIAQEHNRPTILLTTADDEDNLEVKIARGSARSANNINLYDLVKSQAHLLHKFGGHPFAAGLSLPVENIALFRESINQQLRQKQEGLVSVQPIIQANLIVTVAELGKSLFSELGQSLYSELKILEPCGMGNPVPKLLIKNCWFEEVINFNPRDLKKDKISYIKTVFKLWDDTVQKGFPGVWWGHYREEIPLEKRCDAIVELDFNPNAYNKELRTTEKRFELRLIAVRQSISLVELSSNITETILDCRDDISLNNSGAIVLKNCPTTWDELYKEYRMAMVRSEKLALAYPPPENIEPEQIWQQLVGMAKYLSRTEKKITTTQLQEKLGLSDRTLNLGLKALASLGFKYQINSESCLQIDYSYTDLDFPVESSEELFLEAIREEQFQRQYFYQISLSTLQENLI
jgi:single-stranded-DNA-specific exonuclease